MVASYTNPGGSGNRTASVTATTTATAGGGAVTQLVDGSQANSFWWSGGQSGREVRFDFGTPKWVVRAKWYQDNPATHGTWQWQGSPDASTWTNIGATFTLGDTTLATQEITTLQANAATYRYYRMLQTAGSTSQSPYLRETEFMLDDSVTTIPPTVVQATQAAVEEFYTVAGPNLPARATQIVLEHWVSAAGDIPERMITTVVSLEEWYQIPPPIIYQARAMVMA